MNEVQVMDGWWWNALSAVGTLAAVVVALWFSVQSVRLNGRSEKDRSELAAAKMLSPLMTLERKAAALYAHFSFEGEDFVDQHPNVLLEIQMLEVMARSISVEDLYPLLHLEGHAAKRSARALGLIQTFSDDAVAILLHPSWDPSRGRKIMHKRWAGMLAEVNDHLSIAVTVCAAAASTGAPRPMAEETRSP